MSSTRFRVEWGRTRLSAAFVKRDIAKEECVWGVRLVVDAVECCCLYSSCRHCWFVWRCVDCWLVGEWAVGDWSAC